MTTVVLLASGKTPKGFGLSHDDICVFPTSTCCSYRMSGLADGYKCLNCEKMIPKETINNTNSTFYITSVSFAFIASTSSRSRQMSDWCEAWTGLKDMKIIVDGLCS